MNPKTVSSLRNRFKLTKRYYSNPTEENKNLLNAKSNECSNMIVGLTVCPCHVTYVFQSESTLHSCLNVKELLARSRREI